MINYIFLHIPAFIAGLIVINTFAAIVTVFHAPRNIAATWAWLLVLTLIPGVGFLLFMFTGRGLGHAKLFKMHTQDRIGLQEVIAAQRAAMPKLGHIDSDRIVRERQQTVELFRRIDHAPLTRRNAVKIYTDGNDKFAALLNDIAHAEDSIHIEYYTFYPDNIGHEIRDALILKAYEGVEVRVVYDAYGSHGTSAKFWAPLTAAGGRAVPFVTSTNTISRFRLNYHDHRKIVVIDGKVGYTGGFNIGDQYLSRNKKFGYWRDTHLRILGHGVSLLQMRFMMDWNASVSEIHHLAYDVAYFPAPDAPISGTTSMQVVTSGPDSEVEQIKLGFINLINAAKHRVWLQSPYLVPDESVITALRMAVAAGVDVRIMIPCMPDHPFIYRATQYYAHLLTDLGVKIYTYDDGFLHAKTMIVDDDLSTVGSANQDFRSYGLNFEVNTFMYDSDVNAQLASIFLDDTTQSTLLTKDIINSWSHWLRFKQNFSRLLSPVL